MLLLETIKVICQAAPEPDKSIDWSGMLPTGIAFLAFLVSIRTATQGKRLEVRTKRFERLAMQPVENSFAAADQLFQAQASTPASTALQTLVERVTDINITLSHINAIYTSFQYTDILEAGERFTDQVFAGQTQPLVTYASEYALWKTLVLDALYKALDREIGGWMREVKEWFAL